MCVTVICREKCGCHLSAEQMDTRRRPAAAAAAPPAAAATHPTFQLGCFAASIQTRISSQIKCRWCQKFLFLFSRLEYRVTIWQYPPISSLILTFVYIARHQTRGRKSFCRSMSWFILYDCPPSLGAGGDFTISFVRPGLDRRRQRQAAHRGDLFNQPTPAKSFQKLSKIEIQPLRIRFLVFWDLYYPCYGMHQMTTDGKL